MNSHEGLTVESKGDASVCFMSLFNAEVIRLEVFVCLKQDFPMVFFFFFFFLFTSSLFVLNFESSLMGMQ